MTNSTLSGIICLICIGTLGCVQSSFNIATQSQDYTITSTEKEVALGRKISRQVEKELPLLPDESVQNRVRSLGDRLAAVCERQDIVYRFNVVEDEAVNAFSLPGGYVYINSGLVDASENDDELASVIAHEIAHIAARHAINRYESSLGIQLLQLAAIATGQGKAAQGVSIAMRAAQLAYSRDDELEADRLGVKYMQEIGLDAAAILTFLDKLHEKDKHKYRYLPRGVTRPQYALTHPFVPERIRTVKEALYGVADYIDYLNTTE